MTETTFFDTSDVEASLKNMTAARDKGIGVLSIIKRVVGERARKTNPICRCIDTTNEEVDYPEGASIGYVSEEWLRC